MANVGDLHITISAGTLPSGAVYNAQTYFNAIVNRMRATVAQGNVLWGQLGGDEPDGALDSTDSGQPGLWFGDPDGGHGYWNDWNDDASKYLPIPLVCGQYSGGDLTTTTFVCGASTADTTITTPDGSGTLALQSDMIQALGTQTYSGMPTVTIDWSNRAPVYIKLNGTPPATQVINATNDKDGLIMDFWLENSFESGTYVLSMPGVFWPDPNPIVAGTPTTPVLSVGVTGMRVIDHIRVARVGGSKFGQLIARDYQIAKTVDPTVPIFVSATGSGSTINITMSKVMAGGPLDAGDFSGKINGTVTTATGAIYSGTTVTVTLSSSFKSKDTVLVSYSGFGHTNQMKSISGVAASNFADKTVDVTGSGGGGIHNDPHSRGTGPTGRPKAEP